MAVSFKYLVLSALSGCVWAAIAFLLGHEAMWPFIWGGIVTSPLIGLAVGLLFLFAGACERSLSVRIFLSLATFYLAVVLFGVSAGIFDAMRLPPDRNALSIILQAINGCLWGVTITGFLWSYGRFRSSIIHLSVILEDYRTE
jgi:hypothetical protein